MHPLHVKCFAYCFPACHSLHRVHVSCNALHVCPSRMPKWETLCSQLHDQHDQWSSTYATHHLVDPMPTALRKTTTSLSPSASASRTTPRAIHTPAGRPECINNADCPPTRACGSQKKCVDPCPGLCGHNAVCRVINHNPLCSCNAGYTGSPYQGCRQIPRKLFAPISCSARSRKQTLKLKNNLFRENLRRHMIIHFYLLEL